MTSRALETVILPAISKHTASVIFLHGLGDSGYGWKPVAEMLRKNSRLRHVKWILPHAPIRPVTANFGMEMRAWFDITSFDFRQEDEQGMLTSAKVIEHLITAEVESGIRPDRVVLGGFSQGGVMSIMAGLTGERRLAGLAILSGWLPLKSKISKMTSKHTTTTPVFWGHGSKDPLVKPKFGEESVKFLVEDLGMSSGSDVKEGKGVMHKVYEGVEHSACPEELEDLSEWMASVIPPTE